jgi:hypothetical protein
MVMRALRVRRAINVHDFAGMTWEKETQRD